MKNLELIVVGITTHLTWSEAERLIELDSLPPAEAVSGEGPCWYLTGPECWLFYAGDVDENVDREKWPGLFDALKCAEAVGAKWLRLDQDGDPIEGLEVHEW